MKKKEKKTLGKKAQTEKKKTIQRKTQWKNETRKERIN